MKSEIRQKVDRLGERHELRRREADAGKASDQRTPEKRTADAAGLGTSLGSQKRMKYDTPIMDMLQRMVPTGSSLAVAGF